MGLSVGIVGLPNAGKSTLFNALLSKQQALAANYPFATIEPNVGVVAVPDSRLGKLAEVVARSGPSTSLRISRPPVIPATVQFVDIAGLVKGAHKGEGLGNKFLAHIREADLICHVLRGFEDPDVVHVAGGVDPKQDLEVVETELMLADLETLEKQREPFGFAQGKPQGQSTKEDLQKWEIILRLKAALNQNRRAIDAVTDEDEKELVKDLNLLTMKPILYALNISEKDLEQSVILSPSISLSVNSAKNLDHRRFKIGDPSSAEAPQDDNVVIVSAKIEAELAALTDQEQKEYLKELGLEQSGLERLITKAYGLLGLISFLTAGEKEVRAWTIKRGTTAPKAAGVIHTDFETNFIKAEVVSFGDFVKVGGWVKAREQGKVRLEGRDYIVRDGDVIDFKVGV
ncbi:MAG: redox-regulated ATPase YchF [Candidatus Chisholmbacteria bacterium]|nr:redox-regulated ATPase YchF [Candidatus Chisholmbacteria bacterium]